MIRRDKLQKIFNKILIKVKIPKLKKNIEIFKQIPNLKFITESYKNNQSINLSIHRATRGILIPVTGLINPNMLLQQYC